MRVKHRPTGSGFAAVHSRHFAGDSNTGTGVQTGCPDQLCILLCILRSDYLTFALGTLLFPRENPGKAWVFCRFWRVLDSSYPEPRPKLALCVELSCLSRQISRIRHLTVKRAKPLTIVKGFSLYRPAPAEMVNPLSGCIGGFLKCSKMRLEALSFNKIPLGMQCEKASPVLRL